MGHARLSLGLVAMLLLSCGGGDGDTSMTAPSDLSYPSPPAMSVGHAISPLAPSVTGTVTTYSVSPALPSGLSLSASSGVIAGTPAAPSDAREYTVTATNSSGSTTATVALSVSAAALAPAIGYGSNGLTLSVSAAALIPPPSNSGGAAATWSINPALSGGLSLNATSGVISGTPTAPAAPSSYTVTAMNASGQSSATLRFEVQKTLVDLGHTTRLSTVRQSATRVLSLDVSKLWNLWNYSTGQQIARGTATCASTQCTAGTLAAVDLEAGTMVDESAAGLEVRSSSDGTVIGTIPTQLSWWRLASDGSYVCGGSPSALTVWSPTGTMIASRAGDYSQALVFAAAGQIQVALGPAGANVIETVGVPSGTSTVSSAFQGTFSSWFLDGQRFLSTTGNTVFTYSSSAVQQDVSALAAFQNLMGQGNWFWTYAVPTLSVFKVGASATPAASFTVGSDVMTIGSGTTIGIMSQADATISVVDLSGASPVKADFTAPTPIFTAYAATSASQWVAGSVSGVLLDGASLGGTTRYFAYGTAWSIAASSQRIAVATASGVILYFNAGTDQLEGSLGYASSQLAMSSDGTVLASTGDQIDALPGSDQSIHVYSLPAGSLTYSWSYTLSNPLTAGTVVPTDISLSASGTLLGQVLVNYTGPTTTTCSRQVTPVAGGSVQWSDTFAVGANQLRYGCFGMPVRLSADGSGIAVSDSLSTTSATNIYHNGVLVTAVPGWVVGWLDTNRVLVNQYSQPSMQSLTHAASSIYSASGTLLASPALPPMSRFDVVGPDSIYDPGSGLTGEPSNVIYSLTTGAPTWTSFSPAPQGLGAIAGPDVVFQTGSQIVLEPY